MTVSRLIRFGVGVDAGVEAYRVWSRSSGVEVPGPIDPPVACTLELLAPGGAVRYEALVVGSSGREFAALVGSEVPTALRGAVVIDAEDSVGVERSAACAVRRCDRLDAGLHAVSLKLLDPGSGAALLSG